MVDSDRMDYDRHVIGWPFYTRHVKGWSFWSRLEDVSSWHKGAHMGALWDVDVCQLLEKAWGAVSEFDIRGDTALQHKKNGKNEMKASGKMCHTYGAKDVVDIWRPIN